MKTFSTTSALFTEMGILMKTRMQSSLPLPFAQCQTLAFVAQEKKPSMQDVAHNFKITAPSATFLADELVRAGLVKRVLNSKDRRKIELALTSKGKKVYRTYIDKREKVLNRMFRSRRARQNFKKTYRNRITL